MENMDKEPKWPGADKLFESTPNVPKFICWLPSITNFLNVKYIPKLAEAK